MRPPLLCTVVVVVGAAALTACTSTPRPVPPGTASGSLKLLPFNLLIASIDAQPMGNSEIVTGVPDLPDPEAVRIATESARAALEAYLNAQFVAAATRFSAAPLDGLLSPRAAAVLDDNARRGLGVLDLPVRGGVTGPAIAHAVVLVEGPAAYAVTLSYEAHLEVVLGDGTRGPLIQRGTMAFVPIGGGYRAEAVDVTLEAPDTTVRPPPGPPAPPADSPPNPPAPPAAVPAAQLR
ncbi:MAG: hypothetical protein M3N52_11525, partial [Actinomycetota bacterium]|nr:hypothetical protein [Actinomycetota bacterium]